MSVIALGDQVPSLPQPGEYWIAPTATLIGRVTIKKNASVWYGAVLRGDADSITIGENSNVQDGAILHADPGYPLTVGDSVVIGHMAMLHGCTIGDGCVIGIGAIILNGAKIGKNCLIGAGALVTGGKDIPDESVVMGSPGRIVRQLTDDDRQAMAGGAERYVENWRRHAAGRADGA